SGVRAFIQIIRNQDCNSACGRRIAHLESKGTSAAADQRDRPCRKSRKVPRTATQSANCLDRRGRVANRALSQDIEVIAMPFNIVRECWAELLEQRREKPVVR